MEFVTSASAPPSLPPPQKQYQAQAVIYLTNKGSRRGSAVGDDKPGLVRAISRGSLGRRSSAGENNESGGGLRRILSRGDKSDAQGRRSSDGNALNRSDSEGAATAGAPPLQRTKSAELRTGKWVSPVMAGVVGNSLVVALAKDSVLVPYSSQDTGRQAKQAATSSTSTAAGPSTTGGTESHGAHTASGGGIGEKIKNIFRRSSSHNTGNVGDSSTAASTARAESSVSENTAVDAPLNSLEGHHQLAEQKHDLSYPAYINGAPVKYIVVPLTALDSKTISIKEDKKVWIVRVPVTGHLGRFAEPALSDIGQAPDETWGRSGEIDFLFDSKNWIGAKDEAELLHFALTSTLNPTAV